MPSMSEIADARARYQAGDIAGAEAICRQVLVREPRSWAALQILGMIAQQRGDAAAAESFFAQALASAPGRADLLRERATALASLSRLDEAVGLFEQSLAIEPRDLVTLNNLGIAQLRRRDFDASIRAFQQALAIDPDLVAAVNNLGNVYRERGQLDLAADWYRRAVALAPTRSSAINNLAVTLRDQGRVAEAIAAYRQAVALDPANIPARGNLAAALSQIGDRDGAVAEYREAFRRDPRSGQAASGLMQELSHIADWPVIATLAPIVDGMNQSALAAGLRVPEQALHNITRTDDLAYNLAIARSHSQATDRRMAWQRPQLIRHLLDNYGAGGGEKLRIGYLSADIWDHPIAHLASGLFAAHDRKNFAVHVYAYGRTDESAYRRRIASDADVFVTIDGLDALAASQRIADARMDILIELSGHTSSARLEIAALRPAPLQLHWLGYPGSIGADFLDYLIADRHVVPDSHLAFYGEKILRLPNSYQVNNGEQPIAGGMTRALCGLPEDGMVLCCFNQIAKLEPVIFDLWMKLLAEFPHTVLWLLAGTASAAANLRRFAAERGIAPERLIFAPKLDKARHLGRIGLADLALDTRIYNGHTTTSDALYAGLPVVAMRGRHFASRVSASLLTTQGLEELIANDLDGYHGLARALIQDRPRLSALRAKVMAARSTRPLFDTARFTRNLEAAYGVIWQRHKSGLAPQSLDLVEG
jgi:protein O-GlcNAc transferase